MKNIISLFEIRSEPKWTQLKSLCGFVAFDRGRHWSQVCLEVAAAEILINLDADCMWIRDLICMEAEMKGKYVLISL